MERRGVGTPEGVNKITAASRGGAAAPRARACVRWGHARRHGGKQIERRPDGRTRIRGERAHGVCRRLSGGPARSRPAPRAVDYDAAVSALLRVIDALRILR